MSHLSEWREAVPDAVLYAFSLYGSYPLTDGFSGSLSLPAMDIMFNLEDVPKRERPEMIGWLTQINQNVMEILRARQQRESKRG